MAIEVHIPRDIDEHTMPFIAGMSKKHCMYIVTTASVVIPTVLFGGVILPGPIIMFISIVMGMFAMIPIMLDFKQRGVMQAEYVIANMFHFATSQRNRHYEHIDYPSLVDDKLEGKWCEIEKAKYVTECKKNKKKKRKQPRP